MDGLRGKLTAGEVIALYDGAPVAARVSAAESLTLATALVASGLETFQPEHIK